MGKRKLAFLLGVLAVAIGASAATTTIMNERHPATAVSASVRQESVYDRVIRTGTLRCAYTVYPPDTIKDPNTGKLSGIFVEAMERATQALHLKLEWTEEVPWGGMIEGLQNDRYDAVCSGVWENTDRGRVAAFSRPLFYSALGVYVRADETRFGGGDVSLLNDPGVRIAITDGEMNATIARTRFPKAQQVALPQGSDFSQMLLTVSTGKADVVFIEPAVAADFMKANPGTVKNIADHPLMVLPTVVMIKRGQGELKDLLDSAFDQLINDGEMDDILKKYEPFPGAFYRDAYGYRVQ